MRLEPISSTKSGPHFGVDASVRSEASAAEHEAKRPQPHYIDYVFDHRSDAGRGGDVARSIFRDPCFPGPSDATYAICVAHVIEVHGGRPDVLEVLEEMWRAWFATVSFGPNPNAPIVPGFAPREDICAAAMDLGIHTRHGNDFCKAWCPYHTPGDGSGEPSLVLWRDINVFRCESPRCFVWGFPDQLRAGKYQGVHT